MSKFKAGNLFDIQGNLKDQDSNDNVSPKSFGEAMQSLKRPSARASALGLGFGLNKAGSVSETMASLTKASTATSALGLGLGNTGAMSEAMQSFKRPSAGASALGLGFGLNKAGSVSETMASLTKASTATSALGLGLGNTGAMSEAMQSLTKASTGVGGLAKSQSFSETMASLNKTSTKNIHKTANALVKSGKRPTLAAIREELGSGSFTTISEAMKSWREEQEELEQTLATSLPPDLADKLQVLGVNFWEAANTLSNERLSEDYKTLKLMQERIMGKLAQAEEAIETLQQENSQANTELEQLSVANEQLKAEINMCESARHNTSQELNKAHNQINEQSEQIKKLLDQQQELINTLTRFSNNDNKGIKE